MSTATANPSHADRPDVGPVVDPVPADTSLSGPRHGNPGIVGIPTVIAGAVGLGLVTLGYGVSGAAIPIIMTATSIGLLITTVWAAALGQNASASLFAVFFGFYSSYAALGLGFGHDWYSIATPEQSTAQAVWLICWLVTIALVTVTTLRLPSSFTLLLGLVVLALALLLAANLTGVTALTYAGGIVVFLFIALAAYLYADIMFQETGGRGLPLGKPIISS